MTTWLTTREAVTAALDIAETARADAQVDDAIASATGTVQGFLHRQFRPTLATRTFRWPAPGQNNPTVLRLDADELISATTITAAGVAIPSTDYFLEPRSGPPYTRVEIDTSSSSSFDYADTPQRAISITGLWGYDDDSRSAGALAAAVSSTSATTVTVSDGSVVGVGDVLRVDDERMQVTGRLWVDSGDTVGADLAAQVSARSLSVTDGSAFSVGESLLVGSERMLVTDVAGNTLTVQRARSGSVLAAHTTGAMVYASRLLQVERGVLGTTAATHLDAAAVTAHVVPGPVRQLATLEALVLLGLGRSGGSSQSGQGATSADAGGGGLAKLRDQVWQSHGRKGRMRSV